MLSHLRSNQRGQAPSEFQFSHHFILSATNLHDDTSTSVRVWHSGSQALFCLLSISSNLCSGFFVFVFVAISIFAFPAGGSRTTRRGYHLLIPSFIWALEPFRDRRVGQLSGFKRETLFGCREKMSCDGPGGLFTGSGFNSGVSGAFRMWQGWAARDWTGEYGSVRAEPRG